MTLWMVLGEGRIGAVTGDIELDVRRRFVTRGQTSPSSHWSAVAVGEVSRNYPRKSTPLAIV